MKSIIFLNENIFSSLSDFIKHANHQTHLSDILKPRVDGEIKSVSPPSDLPLFFSQKHHKAEKIIKEILARENIQQIQSQIADLVMGKDHRFIP